MSIWLKFRKAPVRVVKIAHKRHRIKLKRSMLKLKWALAQEKAETKQMMFVYRRYTQGAASKEEIRLANEQFVDILKGLGLGVFAVLPFAPITIPVAIKLGKYVGVDILPSSFAAMALYKKASQQQPQARDVSAKATPSTNTSLEE